MVSQFQVIKEFYDKEYYGALASQGKLPLHCRIIGRRMGAMTGKSVLDVACGTGEWLSFFRSQGANVSGIDLSETAISICRQHFDNGDFFCGPAESLPFEDATFDLVTCMGSLEHFLDKPLALSEIKRVAKPSAKIVILVPNAGFLTRRLGFYRGTTQTKVKEDVLDLAAWASLLESSGFRVIDRWRDLHPLSLTWIKRASVLMWPVRLLQAIALPFWPIGWQYQVYFYCELS